MSTKTGRLSRRDWMVKACVAAGLGVATERVVTGQSHFLCGQDQHQVHFDTLGLIVQRDCDGADTAQREGMYWLGQWVLANLLNEAPYNISRIVTYGRVMDLLEQDRTGRFRRHPTQTRLIGEGRYRGPINDPITTSRDQVVPLIAAMGVHRDFERLDRFRNRLREDRYFVNRDVLLAYEEFIKRARDVDLLLSGALDRELLDKAVDLRVSAAKSDKDDVGDDLNLIVQLLLGAVRRGDKVSAIRARYARERPVNYGVYLSRYRKEFPGDLSADKDTMAKRIEEGLRRTGTDKWRPDCTAVVGVMRWYCRAETGGNPGLADMYDPILSRLFAAPIPD